MLFIFSLVLLLPSVYPYTPLTSDYKLEFVSAVFRHGDRTPITAYPNSPHQESFWPQGFGQLTTTGMNEEYHLGQIYKQLYIDTGFLSEQYVKAEVYIRSTDLDRTLMSGQSMLSALYPPNDSQQFREGLPWQPIPIHTVPEASDKLLKSRSVPCPTYQRLLDLDPMTDEYKEIEKENKDLLEMLSQVTGAEYSVSNVWSLYDQLFVEKTHNLTMPSWFTDNLFDRLKLIHRYSFNLFFNTEEKKKITGGVWANEVITNMQMKAKGSSGSIDKVKAILYSAHDTTVAAMLSVFDMYDEIQPPYSSTFVIELYSRDKENFVKFRYRNSTFDEIFIDLMHPGCSQDPCPLNELLRSMQLYMLTEKQWDELCEDSSSTSTSPLFTGLSVAFGVCGFILIVTLVVMVIVLIAAFRQRNKIKKYKQLTTTEEM